MRSGDRALTRPLGAAYFSSYAPGEGPASIEEATSDIGRTFGGRYGPWWPAASAIALGRDGRLQGVLLAVRAAPWPDVLGLPFVVEVFVVPAARRHGLARPLVATALDAMHAAGTPLVGLRVGERNLAARRLYVAAGFTTARRGEPSPGLRRAPVG